MFLTRKMMGRCDMQPQLIWLQVTVAVKSKFVAYSPEVRSVNWLKSGLPAIFVIGVTKSGRLVERKSTPVRARCSQSSSESGTCSPVRPASVLLIILSRGSLGVVEGDCIKASK